MAKKQNKNKETGYRKTRLKNWLIAALSKCKQAQERHPVYFGVFKVLFIGMPVLIFSYSTVKFQQPLPYQVELQDYLSSQPSRVVVLLSWSVIGAVLIQVTDGIINMFNDRYILQTYELAAFVSAVDRIVGSKLGRFEKYSKTLSEEHNITDSMAFQDITQPDSQIENIIRNLFMLFATLSKDDTLHIVLVKMESGAPVSWIKFMPDDKFPDNSILQRDRDKCLFSHCARKKQAIVIPDIEKHLATVSKKLFVPTEPNSSNVGSIICYPIINEQTGVVMAALSLKSNKPFVFHDYFDKKYGYMIISFIKRIRLEMALQTIKGRVMS